jgi:hypothetical protein
MAPNIVRWLVRWFVLWFVRSDQSGWYRQELPDFTAAAR